MQPFYFIAHETTSKVINGVSLSTTVKANLHKTGNNPYNFSYNQQIK